MALAGATAKRLVIGRRLAAVAIVINVSAFVFAFGLTYAAYLYYVGAGVALIIGVVGTVRIFGALHFSVPRRFLHRMDIRLRRIRWPASQDK